MTSENRIELQGQILPLIDNPKEFLTRPINVARIEVGVLVNPPTLDLLKWLPTLDNSKVGLVYQNPYWFTFKVGERLPPHLMRKDSDILLHSHYLTPEDAREDFSSYPSLSDLLSCSGVARDFIACQKGLIRFWPIQEQYKELAAHTMFDGGSWKGLADFVEFLRK